ncbi:neogenin-like [Eriocheir sinensis]|uniref:neogenin-like n=1 Tax=Eriocheir sinensis TaxID=95602 RepID=UPI0021C5A3AF|nr:neogenin-like [Eriocheir sinensis]XP_050705266.1 neogenin-like [Eriocheir sinensis]
MEFVISLRAFNNVGDGQPVYQQVHTQPEEEEVVEPTLDPAVWVKAVVLTPFTVVLQWADTMLSQNQLHHLLVLILQPLRQRHGCDLPH